MYNPQKGNVELSDEHVVTGDYCVKMNRTLPPEDSSNVYLIVGVDITEYQGKTVLFKADILNTTNANISLQLNDTFNAGYVAVPAGASMATYSCTLQLSEEATEVQCLISISNTVNQKYIFTDNWCLEVVE